jgi:hypothetical protein
MKKRDSLAKHMKNPLKPGRRKKLTLKTPDERKPKSNEISRQFRSPVTK